MTNALKIHLCRGLVVLLFLATSLPAQSRNWRATPAMGLGRTMARASAGDTVRVAAGVYHEDSVMVNRPLTILADPGAILDGGEHGGHLLMVRASGVTLRGLFLRNSGHSQRVEYAALLAEECRNLVVEDCRFERNFFGLYLAHCSASVIRRNVISADGTRETSSGNGIHLWYCREMTLENNRINGHRDGIYLEFVRHARLTGNHSFANLRYGLHFMFSDSCHYRRNEFDRNGAGVAVMYSHWVEMVENRFHDNWGPASYGVLLKDISDSEIRGNHFLRNTTGLHVEASNRLVVKENDFQRNGWALRLMANSTEGTYTDNRFVANAFDVATNGRQNYSRFRRNYWDRHRGYDLDRDGFGDTPYRPVGVFSHVVEEQGPALVLLRSLFVDLLDAAERAFPLLTPASLQDEEPRMKELP